MFQDFMAWSEEQEFERVALACGDAAIETKDNKYYRMRLVMPGVVPIVGKSASMSVSFVVSAIHKLMRRKKSGELLFILGSFFMAVSKDDGDPQAKHFKANITKVVNRFAVAIVEDGPLLLLTDLGRVAVVRHTCVLRLTYNATGVLPLFGMHLLSSDGGVNVQVKGLVNLEECRCASDWAGVIKQIIRVMCICEVAQRGRIISLVKCHAILGNECCGETEESVCREMRGELNIEAKNLVPQVYEKFPVVAPLFSKSLCYHRNEELCKVVNMSIRCLPLVTSDLRCKTQNLTQQVTVCAPEDNFVVTYGIKDQHTCGLNMENEKIFLEIGMVTVDTVNLVLGNLDHATLEANYVSYKVKLSKEKRVLEGKSVKRKSPPNHGDVVKIVKKRPKKNQASVSDALHVDYLGKIGVGLEMDTDYVVLQNKLCGFKHATSAARMRKKVGSNEEGTDVFVKVGETREDNDASCLVYSVMEDLMMPHVKITVVPVIFDRAAWTAHSLQFPTPTSLTWSRSMLRTMAKREKMHAKASRAMTMQICSLFAGVRMSWVKKTYPPQYASVMQSTAKRHTLGKTLYEVILLGVYVGVGDLGPFNCMMNGSGEILLVDINIAGRESMDAYNRKGLFRSSRKFDEEYIECVVTYILEYRSEAADFIDRLKKTAPKNAHLVENEMCPFFQDHNVEILRSGPENHAFMTFLLASFRYNPKKRGATPPQYLLPA